MLGGRDAWVIDAEPRPGFEPHMKEAKFLTKFRGRVWIDKNDCNWPRWMSNAWIHFPGIVSGPLS